MMEKCDAHEAKGIFVYRKGKIYAAAAKKRRKCENTNRIEMSSIARNKHQQKKIEFWNLHVQVKKEKNNSRFT